MAAVQMHCYAPRSTILVFSALTACASAELRVDGTSPAAFVQSHAKLMESLSRNDRARLIVAEMAICTAPAPWPRPLPELADFVPPTMVPLMAVRSKLNGMTFNQILQYSKSLNVKANVGFLIEPPSNNRWSDHEPH